MLRPTIRSPWAVFSLVALLTFNFTFSPQFLAVAQADVSTSLVAYWNFENGSTLGTPLYGSLNLSNVGSPAYTTTGGYGSSKGLSLDGNSYLSSNTYPSALNGNTPYTISAWFKTNVGNVGGILGYGSTGGCLGNNLRLGGSTSIYVYWYGCDYSSSTVANFVGSWHHIAVTNDGTTHKFYYDGAFLNSNTGNTRATTGTQLVLGKTINDVAFNGVLDEVAIYTRALTLTDVQELKNGGLNYNAATTVSMSVAGNAKTVSSRQTITLTAVGSIAGKITFRANGKAIPGCKGVTTVSQIATCPWKSSVKGHNQLSAYLVPTAISSNATATSSTYSITVTPRTTPRG